MTRCWRLPAPVSTAATCRTPRGPRSITRSEGVPFLVEELLATAVRSGWDTISDDVPGSVTASVAIRLADLPPAARPLLTAAALLGRHFDWSLAAATARLDDDEAAELLRQAVQAQLVDVEGAGFRFRHALTRDAVLAAALPTEQGPWPGGARRAPCRRPRSAGGAVPPRRAARERRRRARPRRRPVAAGGRARPRRRLPRLCRFAGHSRPRDGQRRARGTPPTWSCCGRARNRVRPLAPRRWASSCWRWARIPRSGPTSTWCSVPPIWRPAGGTTPRTTPATPACWPRATRPAWPVPMRWPPKPP